MDNTTPDIPAEMLKAAVEANSQPSPQLSIDPDSQKMSVIGDPNDIKPTDGSYTLKFRYLESELSESDKQQMTFDEAAGEYIATVTYTNRRVKPLYREKVDMLVIQLFDALGIVDTDGYDASNISMRAGAVLVENIEVLAELAKIICDIPKDQLEHMDAPSLADFVTQLLVNEPNIVKEAISFLMQRSLLRAGKITPSNEKKPDTQQG